MVYGFAVYALNSTHKTVNAKLIVVVELASAQALDVELGQASVAALAADAHQVVVADVVLVAERVAEQVLHHRHVAEVEQERVRFFVAVVQVATDHEAHSVGRCQLSDLVFVNPHYSALPFEKLHDGADTLRVHSAKHKPVHSNNSNHSKHMSNRNMCSTDMAPTDPTRTDSMPSDKVKSRWCIRVSRGNARMASTTHSQIQPGC